MKRITNKICAVLLSGIFMVMTGVNVNAAEQEYPPAEAVFPEEKVLQIENQIKNTPIYNDKDAEGNFSLKNTRATGTYPTRYGVILVTADKYKGLIPTGHAGIIWTSSTIVESLSNGVTTGPNDWNTSKTSCYGISVKGTTVDEDNEASNWCYRQLGKPYNYNYFNVSTRKKFYCSQLVWAAFKDNYGIDLDTSDFGDAVHPMELVNSSKTYTIFLKLYMSF